MKLLLICACGMSLCGQTIHHIVTTGQSLSIGTEGSPALSTTQPYDNLFVNSGGFIPLVETGVESPGSAIANQITALSLGWVGLVTKHGENGRLLDFIDQTNPACVAQPPYTTMAAASCPYQNLIYYAHLGKTKAVAASREYALSAISITHGESNDQVSTPAATYQSGLVSFRAAIQSNGNIATSQPVGTRIPMFVDQESSWTAASIGSHTTPRSAIGQWGAARDFPGLFYIVGPKYQLPYVDGLHLTNVGYRSLGELIGKAIKTVLVDGQFWTGLTPRSITRAGAVITARFWVPAGSLVFDTSTVTDKGAAKGFEFFDDSGVTPTISSVSIASADTITITLSGTPSGAVQTLAYAYTGIAGAGAGTSGAPHGNVRDDDPTTSQSGGTLYDWLITFREPIGFTWEPSIGSEQSVSAGGKATIGGKVTLP